MVNLDTPEEHKRDEDDLTMLRLTDEGLSRQEVAKRIGVTTCTVIGRLDRIRRAMKKHR